MRSRRQDHRPQGSPKPLLTPRIHASQMGWEEEHLCCRTWVQTLALLPDRPREGLGAGHCSYGVSAVPASGCAIPCSGNFMAGGMDGASGPAW